MNDENQENEALEGPIIFTIPASLTVPGFGFLVALTPIGALPRKRGTRADHRASRRDSSVVPGEQPPLTNGLLNSLEQTGRWRIESDR